MFFSSSLPISSSGGDDHDLQEDKGDDDLDLDEDSSDCSDDDHDTKSRGWSQRATLQLLSIRKKHANLKENKNVINNIIAEELKPWVR